MWVGRRGWVLALASLAALSGCFAFVDFDGYEPSAATPDASVTILDATVGDVGRAAFTLEAPATLRVLERSRAKLGVSMLRDPGFVGGASIELEGPLPPWLTATAGTIDAERNETQLEIVASAGSAAQVWIGNVVAKNADVVVKRAIRIEGVGAAGTFDKSFGDGGIAVVDTEKSYGVALELEGDGATLVLGTVSGSYLLLARFDKDGKKTPDFIGGAQLPAPLDVYPMALFALADRTALIGMATQSSSTYDGWLAHVLLDGGLDPSFGDAGVGTTPPLPDDFPDFVRRQGTGYLSLFPAKDGNGQRRAGVTAFNVDGGLETAFGDAGTKLDDGGWGATSLAGSRFVSLSGFSTGRLTARDANGDLEPLFGDGGVATVPEASCVHVMPDGRLILGGSSGGNVALGRLDANGRRDATFGTAGVAIAKNLAGGSAYCSIGVQGDGKIVLVESLRLYRFDANGTLDPTFGESGEGPRGIGLEPIQWSQFRFLADGRIVLAGTLQTPAGPRLAVGRLWP